MMEILRSRMTMYVLAALATVGLVVTGASGLFKSMQTPAPQEQESASSAAPDAGSSPKPAPALDELGQAPEGTSYKDLGQQCESRECYRLVGIKAEDLKGEKAVDTVYDHLLDQGWGQVPPKGVDDPSDVPKSETYLSNGSVVLKGSTDPYAKKTKAGLMLTHAQPPSS